MLRFAIAILCALSVDLNLHGQASDNRFTFNPGTTYGVAAAYTAPSRNIFAGLAPERKMFMITATADWRVHETPTFVYRWEVEVRPLVFIRNPHQSGNLTFQINGLPASTRYFEGLLLKPCVSLSDSSPIIGPGLTPIGTQFFSRLCDTQWTYAGGVSPLGQRLNFRPHKRWQPFAQANAGFLASMRPVPVDDATKFNFTVELGAGIEWFYKPKRSIAFDVLYHHLSNGGSGDENPSIEHLMFKTNFRFGR